MMNIVSALVPQLPSIQWLHFYLKTTVTKMAVRQTFSTRYLIMWITISDVAIISANIALHIVIQI